MILNASIGTDFYKHTQTRDVLLIYLSLEEESSLFCFEIVRKSYFLHFKAMFSGGSGMESILCLM